MPSCPTWCTRRSGPGRTTDLLAVMTARLQSSSLHWTVHVWPFAARKNLRSSPPLYLEWWHRAVLRTMKLSEMVFAPISEKLLKSVLPASTTESCSLCLSWRFGANASLSRSYVIVLLQDEQVGCGLLLRREMRLALGARSASLASLGLPLVWALVIALPVTLLPATGAGSNLFEESDSTAPILTSPLIKTHLARCSDRHRRGLGRRARGRNLLPPRPHPSSVKSTSAPSSSDSAAMASSSQECRSPRPGRCPRRQGPHQKTRPSCAART